MVGDEEVAGFTIIACILKSTLDILGLLTGKSKVNRQALKRLGGLTSGGGTARLTTDFGSKTNGAMGKRRLLSRKFGNTGGKVVSTAELFITAVSQALMPKEPFSASRELVKGKCMQVVVVWMIVGGQMLSGSGSLKR